MALAKERIRYAQGIDSSSLEFLGSEGHLPNLFDSSNSSSFGFANSLPLEAQPSLNHWAYSSSSSSSVLSFEQSKIGQEECAFWIDSMDREYGSRCENSLLGRDVSCFELANGVAEERFGLLYPNTTGMDSLQDGGEVERGSQKRPYMGGDNMLASKKQCSNNRKAKAKPSPSKDPQSIAAKNRRERISERLKILQDLVPNGTKVDMVTMLEKAISYVKFLQLQVTVLATDEFWPAQGGKAPEVSQVKETIDAILSSHRDRSSTSKQ